METWILIVLALVVVAGIGIYWYRTRLTKATPSTTNVNTGIVASATPTSQIPLTAGTLLA